MKKNIIVIGARGYKYNYGGWETFVTNLVQNFHNDDYQFYIPHLTHVKEDDKKIQFIDGVEVPSLYVPEQGFVTMFTFTIKAMNYYLKYIEENHLKNTVILLLGCKVGPLFLFWKHKLKKLNTKVIINPDGLEWKREKWSWWIKQCFKISEHYSVKLTDYCVCDSKSIENYVIEKYKKFKPRTDFIAYGAEENIITEETKIVKELFSKYQINEKEYYLIVGRFIPENNYETMIKEFMKTNIQKDLVIICNLEKNKFYEQLQEKTNFESDKRIKFVGSVYDEASLQYIRKNAYAYLHGHSAGGTNPSLLEALSITNLNILYDVSYNKEVGEKSCFYFSKEADNLKNILEKVDKLGEKEQNKYGKEAKKRIHEAYTWDIVVQKYKDVFDLLIKEEKR